MNEVEKEPNLKYLYWQDYLSLHSVKAKLKGEDLTKYDTNQRVRKKIDKLLHENHLEQQEICKSTTKEEKEKINKKCEPILNKIKEIEPNFFKKIEE